MIKVASDLHWALTTFKNTGKRTLFFSFMFWDGTDEGFSIHVQINTQFQVQF